MAGQSVSQTPYEQCAIKDQQKHIVNTMKCAAKVQHYAVIRRKKEMVSKVVRCASSSGLG